MEFQLDAIFRFLHVIAGIAWIGLLYYFNLVQVPAMAAAAADKEGPGGAGISKMSRRVRYSGSAGQLS